MHGEVVELTNSCSNRSCFNSGVKRCTLRKYALYCSRECQVNHWKEHKPYCKKLGLPESTARLLEATELFRTGRALDEAGQLDEALIKIRQALAIFQDLVGENDETTANVYEKIGQILSAIGLYKESLVKHRKSLEIRRLIFGENNRFTAISYECIGNVLFYQGRYDDALIGYGKALTVCNNLFGENHMDTAMAYKSVGNVLIQKQQFKEALEILCKAEAIYKRDLGENHQKTVMITKAVDDIAKAYQRHESIENFKTAAQFWRAKFSAKLIRLAMVNIAHRWTYF